jgi:hypothetical protein
LSVRCRCLLLALCVLSLAGCFRSPRPVGVKLREQTRFESEWKGYLRLAPFKSLAVAGDLNGVYVSGFAQLSATRELAVEGALQHCRQRRLDRRIADPCRTYAVGDEKVPDP